MWEILECKRVSGKMNASRGQGWELACCHQLAKESHIVKSNINGAGAYTLTTLVGGSKSQGMGRKVGLREREDVKNCKQ